jgi:hypothetical protein
MKKCVDMKFMNDKNKTERDLEIRKNDVQCVENKKEIDKCLPLTIEFVTRSR